jgi:hypothetical protein
MTVILSERCESKDLRLFLHSSFALLTQAAGSEIHQGPNIPPP